MKTLINPSDDIYQKAVDRLNACRKFKTCIEARICPLCGEDLVTNSVYEQITMAKRYFYTCTKCGEDYDCKI